MKKILILLFLLSCQSNQGIKKNNDSDNIKLNKMKISTDGLIIKKKKK
tara:strand:+ start:567 stop:710 length:144 start_codon:yes stop_codon:yes gene_type:complete